MEPSAAVEVRSVTDGTLLSRRKVAASDLETRIAEGTVRRRTALSDILLRFKDHPRISYELNRYRRSMPVKGNVGTDPLDASLQSLRQYRLLGTEEVVRMFKSIEAGLDAYFSHASGELEDEAYQEVLLRCAIACETVTHANMRLVAKYAMKYVKFYPEHVTDFIQEGMDGLAIAVSRFDYRLGYAFSTYAINWIRQSINRYIANNIRTIRLPVHRHEEWMKLRAISSDFLSKHGREATTVELAALLGKDEADILLLQRSGAVDLESLDRPLKADSDRLVGEIIPDTKSDTLYDDIDREMINATILKVVFESGGLQPKESQILGLFFGIDYAPLLDVPLCDRRSAEEPDLTYGQALRRGGKNGLTLSQIGGIYGLTDKEVRNLKDKALQKSLEALSYFGYSSDHILSLG